MFRTLSTVVLPALLLSVIVGAVLAQDDLGEFVSSRRQSSEAGRRRSDEDDTTSRQKGRQDAQNYPDDGNVDDDYGRKDIRDSGDSSGRRHRRPAEPSDRRTGRKATRTEQPEAVKKVCLQPRFFQHLRSLGCQAEYEPDDLNKVCPVRYYCENLEEPGRTDRCRVAGKTYKPGDRVPATDKCRECFCGQPDTRRNIPSRVECLGVECPDIGKLENNRRQECYISFSKVDSCCPKSKCIPRNTTGSCEYKALYFHEGQKILPTSNPCEVCHCNRRWNGVGGRTCEPIECDLELERDRLLEGCVPVYLQTACCPVDWICPNNTYQIPQDADTGKCYFDGREYDLNTAVDHKHPTNCIQCRCIVPNMVTCIQQTCPPPPKPASGRQCVPTLKKGRCCADYDCSKRIRDPCRTKRCRKDETCIRLVEEPCDRQPCKDYAKCVPKNYDPCTDIKCRGTEQCVPHQFQCATPNCPLRTVCLPVDPCYDEQLTCREGEICRNVIESCRTPPCPKVAKCVNSDPCADTKCIGNHQCYAVPIPCERKPCPSDPVCSSPNCPEISCDSDSIYRPFGKGRDNCPWCEPKKRREAPATGSSRRRSSRRSRRRRQ